LTSLLIRVILSFFICHSLAQASICNIRSDDPYYPNGLATATGYVKAQGRNFVEIYDEIQEKLIRLTFLAHGEKFDQGEYVRAYYYPESLMVQRIFKMTVLKYKKNTQNLGYICRKD
jgi:hypothetical protein